jgi:hypothetical protein
MKKIIIKCVWVLSFCLLFACNAHINKTPIVDKLKTIKTTLTIKDVKKRFGEPKHGHGSYVWHKSGTREIWFWFLAKQGVAPGGFLIAFISLVYPNNPEMTKIIWPDKLKNHDLDYLTKSIESANKITGK